MEGRKGRATGLSSREGRRRVLVLMAARLCRLRGGESDAGAGVAAGEEEMRIANVLHAQEEEKASGSMNNDGGGGGGGGGRRGREQRRSGAASSLSPRCLLSWWPPSWQFLSCRATEEGDKGEVVRVQAGQEGGEVNGFSPLRPTAGARRKVSAGKEEEEVVPSLEAMAPSSEGRDGAVRSEEGSMQRPVCKPEQSYLNIGMGAGLVFLLTRSVAEFNKMMELRSEMETFLKEIKGVVQKKDADTTCVDPENDLACCGSESRGNVGWSNELSVQGCSHDPPPLKLVEGSCTAELDEQSVCNKGYQGDKSLGIDQMEEELKSELELLRLNLDEQESSDLLSLELEHCERGKWQLHCEKSDVSECFDENSVVEHPDPKEQVEEEEDEEDTRDRYSVCPQELMSRLHEVLEAQQEERIAELESALELARVKLREKEMEASWWRDTARLVLQHKQETLLR